MAQADQSVQNATFPTVRADINDNLAALFTDSSGSTAPSVTVAFQDWIDTSGTDPLWKKRNAANNAWITLGTFDGNDIAFEGTLPDQSGNSGEFLTTDGTDASWAAIPTEVKAWVNFDGTGTVAIRASYNVSSITDNGAGNYNVNFTTALVDANYAVNVNVWSSTTAMFLTGSQVHVANGAPTTTSFRIGVSNGTALGADSASGFTDVPYVFASVFR
jgi:hypothetical protein